jgi:hypothetical protein
VIYEHEETWWNDIHGKTPNSSTRAFWQSYLQRHLVAKQEELAKEIMNLALEASLFILLRDFFNIQQNLSTWSRRLYFPSEGRHAAIFRP